MRRFDFQIGALPRSGTAWLATTLNLHKEIFCYHDALQTSPTTYGEAPDRRAGYKYVGDCSSGACLFQGYPAAKAYIYRRDEEVLASLVQVSLEQHFPEISQVCKKWASDALVIPFDDLFSDDEDLALATFCEILEHVTPDVVVDVDKWRHMYPLRVELKELSPQTYQVEEIARRMTWQ